MEQHIQRVRDQVFIELDIISPTDHQKQFLNSALNMLVSKNSIHLNDNSIISLSKRERECLYWLSQVKGLSQIAVNMGVKRTTIATLIKRIKKKLNCNTLSQAVFKGMTLKQLPSTNSKKVPISSLQTT